MTDTPLSRRRALRENDAPVTAATPLPVAEEPARPEVRPPMREEDPRARAARRVAELRDHGAVNEDNHDEFFIDPGIIPPGWSYEWKRKTVLGAEDPAYQVALARQGWEAVPAHRHPSYMPVNSTAAAIERKGMILMERPLEITEEARNRELRNARMQVRQKEQQLSAADTGQFERDNKGASLVSVKKSYEAIPIPEN